MTAAPTLSLGRRVIRTSAITTMGMVVTQVMRLGTSLVMTRLLFPEAFGMMALVTVFFVGLTMLSDIGTGPAIMQSRRGDDPDFLDTAWTVQIIRGVLLWGVTAALTPLVAWFYGEPQLRELLPVAALGLVITGFRPTRFENAARHMRAGHVTIIDLSVQAAGIPVAIALAWALQSVWALVISTLVSNVMHMMVLTLLLPGHRNRLRWERAAVHELVHFGKWIFLSTLCGLAVSMSDRVILGRYLDLEMFGLYGLALALATLPKLLGDAVAGRVLIPVYRESPPAASAANAARVRKLRIGVLSVMLPMTALLAFEGAWLVQLLYDPRYHAAAGIVVLAAVAQAPALLILTCDQAALAMGDSRSHFWLTLARAVLVTAGLLVGFEFGGLAGAIIGQSLGSLAAYPVLVWILRPHGAWDPVLDAQFLGLAAVMGAVALWVNQASLALIP